MKLRFFAFILVLTISFLSVGCLMKKTTSAVVIEKFGSLSGTVSQSSALGIDSSKIRIKKIMQKAGLNNAYIYAIPISTGLSALKPDIKYPHAKSANGGSFTIYGVPVGIYNIVIDANNDKIGDYSYFNLIIQDSITSNIGELTVVALGTDSTTNLYLFTDKTSYAVGNTINMSLKGTSTSQKAVSVQIWDMKASAGKLMWESSEQNVTGDVDLSYTATIQSGWPSTASASGADYRAYIVISQKKQNGTAFEVSGTSNGDTTTPEISVNILFTKDTSPALSGIVDDTTATVTVTVNGSTYTATNNADGTWTLAGNTITPALTSGTYDVTATAKDSSGNSQLDSTSGELIIDVTAPTITPTAPITATTVGDSKVTYTLSEALVSGTITWTRTGGAIDANTPHVRILYGAELETGAHTDIELDSPPSLVDTAIYTIAFDGTDKAGNVGTQITIANVTFDSSLPVITVDTLITNNTKPALSGTVDDTSATISINVNGKDYPGINNGNGTWSLGVNTIDPALVADTYNVKASAINSGGKTGKDVTQNELVVDLTAPVPTITAPTNTSNSPYVITVVFGEEVTGFDAGDVAVTNGTAANAQELEDGSYYVEITPTNEGTVNVDIPAGGGCNDLAGNASQAAGTSVDTIYSNGNVPTILSGSVKLDNSSLTVYFSEGVFNNAGGALTTSDFWFQKFGPATLDSLTKVGGGALAGGEIAIRFNITPGVTTNDHNIAVDPADNYSVFDGGGNAMSAMIESTGQVYFNDPIFANYLGDDNNQWTEVGTGGSIINDALTHTADGTASCKFVDPTTAYTGRGIQSNRIPIEGSETYDYEIWAYTTDQAAGAYAATNTRISIRVDYSDGSNTTIAFQSPAVLDAWEQETFTDTAPSSATWVIITVRAMNFTSLNNNDINIDELTMTKQ